MSTHLFTSESVTEGHPDKIADQISDGILDELLKQDPSSRVACETMVSTGIVFVAGEIRTNGYADVQKIARNIIKDIGILMPLMVSTIKHAVFLQLLMNKAQISQWE